MLLLEGLPLLPYNPVIVQSLVYVDCRQHSLKYNHETYNHPVGESDVAEEHESI